MIDGRLEEALTLHETRRARAEQLGIQSPPLHRVPILIGRAADYLDEFDQPGQPAQASRSVLLTHLGHLDEARKIRASIDRDFGSDQDESGTHVLVNLLETGTMTGDTETTRALMRRLAPLAGEGYFGPNTMAVSIGRLLGGGARLLDQPKEARIYYNQGLEFCAGIRFRPETALIRLELAELLLESYPDERGTAIEHLDFAIGEFREMKMQPFLERALSHRGLLKA
jgi:hypothetical protein